MTERFPTCRDTTRSVREPLVIQYYGPGTIRINLEVRNPWYMWVVSYFLRISLNVGCVERYRLGSKLKERWKFSLCVQICEYFWEESNADEVAVSMGLFSFSARIKLNCFLNGDLEVCGINCSAFVSRQIAQEAGKKKANGVVRLDRDTMTQWIVSKNLHICKLNVARIDVYRNYQLFSPAVFVVLI